MSRRLAPSQNTKLRSILEHFVALGPRGMNCFEAANRYHDYVLRTTVSDLWRLYGVSFTKSSERVPNAFGKMTTCTRYSLLGFDLEHARQLLGGT